MTIGGEVPTQAFAITRLLLALPIMMLNNTSQMSPAASCDQMTAEAAAGHVGLQHTCLRVVQRHQRPMGFIRPAVRDPADRRAVCLNGSGEAAQSPDGLGIFCVSGISGAGPMCEEQGNADATELWQHGTLSPDAQARLNVATTVTAEQQAALERGDRVLPRDQLAYLTALLRGMDGKTTEQIRDLTRAPGGGRLVDAMRLATNHTS
jgi:hypothetical protein